MIVEFPAGGYSFLRGVFQYSGGVAAAPGFEIVRVRLMQEVPLEEGFARIAGHLRERGRPTTALCACELRSPAPFTDAGFKAFNEAYVARLKDWGLLERGDNPVARSNVCPAIAPPAAPSLHAFCFTVAANAPATFVVSGSGEAREGGERYRDRTVRYGETSPAALREKATFVVGEIERRLAALGGDWRATTATQVYTVHDLKPFLADVIVERGAARAGLVWHYCRPPVEGLEFEMDCRGVRHEHVIA